jgi:glycosyltransferase involved in cell wall biosynthesis
MTPPAVSVVVASHERPDRLARLLDALAGQTLAPHRFEVVVVFDDAGERTAALLREHALARDGRLRAIRLPAGTGAPSVQRNRGWRAARAPLVAFTDDDCRPRHDWLAGLLTVAHAAPGAVVQGATRPDPEEEHLLGRPLARSLTIEPPSPFGQTCNVLYPRAVLERLEGFAEHLPAPAGEDTDLWLRAQEAGTPVAAAPEALVWHAVTVLGLLAALRGMGRWQHVAYVVRRHPAIRRELALGVFWKPAHAWLVLALAGLGLSRRRPVAAVLAAPWLWSARRSPRRLVLDVAELAVAARGAVRYRTPFL